MTTEPATPETPATPAVIDLDASRAARREGKGDGIEVRQRGKTFRLPIELPVEVLEQLEGMAEFADVDEDDPHALTRINAALKAGLSLLFGAEQWAEFETTAPSIDDLMELLVGLLAAYGVTLGEALRSVASAASDGAPSSPTSSGTTDSTPEPSGELAPTPSEPGDS